MTNSFTKTKIAGILMLIGGAGHLIPSFIGTFKTWAGVVKNGWWNKIPPPWTSTDFVTQKAFWVTWGSFGLPMLMLGALIYWLAKQKIRIPKFTGFALLGYALFTFTLLPAGGMWIFIISAVLLLSDNSGPSKSS